MKGRLKKIGNEYKLYAQDDSCIATNHESPYKKLSLKNCEEIELGFSLVELFDKVDRSIDYHEFDFASFRLGVKSVLELLGDKKFSINEVVELSKILISNPIERCGKTPQELVDAYVKSLQQTEWDVEIEMICPHPEDTYVCGIQYGCDEDGCNHPNTIPLLDENGCLILKRK